MGSDKEKNQSPPHQRLMEPKRQNVDNLNCSLIVYIHAPVRTSYVHVCMYVYNTSGPWNLMLSRHANY